MRDFRTVDGTPVPRTVWVAIAVILVWSLGPFSVALEQLPDLLRGDINGRRIVAGDWFALVPPLGITALFWILALQIRRRSRNARIGIMVVAAVVGGIALIITFVDFDALFLTIAAAFTLPLLAVPFLPGVARWCSE